MSAWARQRQGMIILYFILVGLLLASISYFVFIYNPPNCFDNIKNGLEEGVDCGGGCQLVCPFQAAQPNVSWARAFEIAPGLYNIASEVENPNFSVGTNAQYVLRGYNQENVQVAEVFGNTELYPAEKKIIFETAVDTGEQSIERVFLEFIGQTQWYELPQLDTRMVSAGYLLEDESSTPKMRSTIRNTSTRPIENIQVAAVLYDRQDNIYQVSQTFIERVSADSEAFAYFTWRTPFTTEIQNVEVVILQPRN